MLRNSSGYGSSWICSVHKAGHECSDGNVRPSVTYSQNVITNQNVGKAQNTVVGLLLKLHDGCNNKHPSNVETHIPFIQNLLDDINRHTDLAQGSKNSDLTICTKTGRNGKGSRFGFKNIFMDFEKVINADMYKLIENLSDCVQGTML